MTENTRFAVSVHMLAYLAYKAGEPVSSSEIASSVDTNPVVIRRLLAALVKAGLVSSSKGANGGFALASTPKNITLLDIYRASEPKMSRVPARFAPNTKCPVGAKIKAILGDVFFNVNAAAERELARVSLAEVHRQLAPVCTGNHKHGQ